MRIDLQRRNATLRYISYARLGVLLLLLGEIACTTPAARDDIQRPFSVIMLPDTQKYSEKRPDLFLAQTNWIKQNREKENIVFTTHVGDIVQNRSSKPGEWEAADAAMDVLDGVVPYGVAIGNHDYDSDGGVQRGAATMFLKYFHPDRRFKGQPWYGGASPNGLNSCQLFRAGGTEFIILHLEVNAPDSALEWARRALDRHPTHTAIITMHIYLRGKDGVTRETQRKYRKDGNSPEQIWQKLIRSRPQILMVLCGHVHTEFHQVSENDAGASVLEMLADYQDRKNGGDGYLRIIRFVPRDRLIQVRTYSPVLDRFETDPDSQFSIPWRLPVPDSGYDRPSTQAVTTG